MRAGLIAQADACDQPIVRKDRAAIEADVGSRFFTSAATAAPRSGPSSSPTRSIRSSRPYVAKRFETRYRKIDTYVREGGRWQAVAVQITRIAPAQP